LLITREVVATDPGGSKMMTVGFALAVVTLAAVIAMSKQAGSIFI
jgi:hypothetical protein